ncbi:metacaspase-1-like isoform X2 [Sesamum indicum]|uniref:Metacaspase-1-like isoform X2 n=1 Tax=Sesamum indicum TaxID=4182 RepID=A0A8M8V0T0_SESIN|nr:metacaspase-1-like isoform X2 [Sesamum indicum]
MPKSNCDRHERILSASDQDKVYFMMEKSSSTKPDKAITEAKGFCNSHRKKRSVNNSQYSRSQSSVLSVVTSNQPRRDKRALLCCVQYKNQKSELKGSRHDLNNMRDLLVGQFKFPTESILILAEKEPYQAPTRKNIEDAFQWLMRDIQSGDSLVFYFSGHGFRQRSVHGDEIDGFDETICPVDFKTNGMVSDNYINKTIVNPLIQGVTLHAIIDSCHSGTVLDLPYVYNMNTGKWDDNRAPTGESKDTMGGKAICFSACEDYQQAADTSAFSMNNKMTGAMTSTFIRAVEQAVINKQKLTYKGILKHMRRSLKQVDKVGCFRAGLKRVFHRKILQDPLLSSSEEFDTNTEFKL